LVLLGASEVSFVMVLLAMGGIVLAAAYILRMLQRVVLGQAATSMVSQLPDITVREMVTLAPLVVLVFAIGVYPGPLMELMDAAVTKLVEVTNQGVPFELRGLF
jgi:NADH-quinone oxidoreductase subunit M